MAQPMLEFQKQILEDLVAEDALVILAPGLGLFTLLCSFIQLHCKGNHLVLLLNTTPAQDIAINERLTTMGVDPEHRMRVIDYDTPAETRNAMYRQSGIFSVTSRILGVDMLLNRVPKALISGIIVYNAHRVRPHSMEELILKDFRKENQDGFIKALSDQPEAFTTGFAPLQNTLKTLQLRKVHLWPRFQVLISDNLAQTSGDVVELRQPMTEAMDKIQQALVECMEATLAEVRRLNPMVDVQDFTIENSFFKSFDAIVRRQLDPIWHQISPASKQLVGDLKILRQLLDYLTRYDCVSFYSFLETVIASNTSKEGKQIRQSQWLFLDAADVAISTARKRVYYRPGDPEYTGNTQVEGQSNVQLVLEEQPKWALLRDILQEIEHDIATAKVDGSVLVMVNEKRTCSQLREYVSRMSTLTDSNERPVLTHLAQKFFQWRKNLVKVQQSSISTESEQAQASSSSGASTFTRGVAPRNKRRRVRGGSAAASSSRAPLAQTFKEDIFDTIQQLDSPLENESVAPASLDSGITLDEHDILPEFPVIPLESMVTIQCYENDMDEQMLEDLRPRFVIMYDPDPAFVRRLEVYRALHPDIQVRVYFVIYENSIEEQNYLSLIRKEKEAFERLIREKSVYALCQIMAIPLPQKGTPEQASFARAISTRVAGGQLKETGPPTVVIDMREFRSSLPVILYTEGIKIMPCTLQVGDYILSPDMCVERKSISDLISSFNSGRLYTQCESMSMYYKTPILLIEFDQNKSFSLQSLSDMKDTIVLSDLSSKLVLLTLTFPKLKIIWSSSPHETAAIFEELKKTEPEPDAEKAVLVGAEDAGDADRTYNMTPQDILRSMPGVTSRNYKILMNAVENLEQLCAMNQNELKALIGEEPARKLHGFIHQKAG